MLQFTITRMQIGKYEVPVPHGISELLNQSGAWVIKSEDTPPLKEYDRRVEKRDGKLFTILTKKRVF
jgi:hypothetical protein